MPTFPVLAAADSPADVPLVAVVPFVLMLLSIAVLPLIVPHWWHKNRNKAIVALVVGVPMAIWGWMNLPESLLHIAHEYVSFIVLLGSLFVISGGLFLEGDLRATPRVNCTFLVIGAVLANLIGTTGAAMVLIRPLLATNSERQRVRHTVVFFIFMVCNTGGCLTPLGDPPLYLGYLRGVPFEWTLQFWPEWLAVNGALLLIYALWDVREVRRETPQALRADLAHYEPLRMRGTFNVALLLGIVALVALEVPSPWREAGMVGLALASYFLTPKDVHQRNAFSWEPIAEVAILFAAIFAAMVPALELLQANGPRLGLDQPMEYFWTTGMLSGFLDNAPTYLTFASVASGVVNEMHPGAGVDPSHLERLIEFPEGTLYLTAISLGAVFLGALTYIGNGPNFMVKAIAESRSVRMPSFFGYMGYSVIILLPVYFVVSWVFLG
jgi:Na+/H+ antiporter NhaD/arsenite permease-like protein